MFSNQRRHRPQVQCTAPSKVTVNSSVFLDIKSAIKQIGDITAEDISESDLIEYIKKVAEEVGAIEANRQEAPATPKIEPEVPDKVDASVGVKLADFKAKEAAGSEPKVGYTMRDVFEAIGDALGAEEVIVEKDVLGGNIDVPIEIEAFDVKTCVEEDEEEED